MSDAAEPRRAAAAIFWRWPAIYAGLIAAWGALWLMDPAAGLPAGVESWRELCLSAARDASIPVLWGMWAVMGAAMMLPTALPAIRDFGTIADTAAARGAEAAPGRAVAALIAGYLAVWAGFAALAAPLQAALSGAALVGETGRSLSPWLTAALLALAGAWQFSSLKEACLSRCRMPMTVFLGRWKPGPRAAFEAGLRMGADCLGCCWALMALAFVGGASNILWMGAAALFMALEKLPEIGRPLTRPAGYALLSAAAAVAILSI